MKQKTKINDIKALQMNINIFTNLNFGYFDD